MSLGPTTSDLFTHLIVNDDQAGPYRRLAIRSSDRTAEGYPWCLEQPTFVLPALPESVFMKADFAELVAREQVAELIAGGPHYAGLAKVPEKLPANVDSAFHSSIDRLVAPTYLTQGWKYAHRMLRNGAPEQLKTQLMRNTMPRHVWVVEFCLPEDLEHPDPCARRVRGHVVIDPTAGPLMDSVVVVHVPGMLMTVSHELSRPGEAAVLLSILGEDEPYFPKVRGWNDYAACSTGGGPVTPPNGF